MKTIPTAQIIVIDGFQLGTATSHAEAIKLRDEIVKEARELPAITTADIALDAGMKLRALTTFAAQIEVAREAAKAPVLERGRAIDALAKDLVNDVNAQIARVKPLLGSWAEQEEKRAQEIQRKAREEEDRIRLEADRAEQQRQAVADAEKKRVQDQADAAAQALIDKANNAKSVGARDNLLAKADDIRTAAESKIATIDEKAQSDTRARDELTAARVGETRHAVTLAQPVTLSGISGTKKPCYEITDINAVFRHNPLLCKLTPADAVIKAAIKALKKGETIPGLRHWMENSATVR